MARLISRLELTTFICPDGHITRSFEWSSVREIACGRFKSGYKESRADVPDCGKPATAYYAPRGDNAQRFDPVLVARNPKTGEVRHLASGKARVPHGFERQELRTRGEIDAACRQLDRQDERAHDQQVSQEQMGREMYADPLRGYSPQTPQGRDLMEYAERQYQNSYTPRFSGGNYVEVFENDRSNRD